MPRSAALFVPALMGVAACVLTAVAAEKRELLSSHNTVARFDGLSQHTCRGLTSLCPDRCGESGPLASFTIIRYRDYKKPGEYGDPKQTTFQFLVEDNMKRPKVPASLRDKVMALKPGDVVELDWIHEYVTNDGGSYPERPVVRLEKSNEPAGQLPPPKKPAPGKGRAGPAARATAL